MGQESQGFAYLPDSLKKAMRACAAQVDDVAWMERAFAPAELRREDFGMAPGSESVAAAYCGDPGRYESVAAYLKDLRLALEFVALALGESETTYVRAAPR
ncbi:hypothetical protein [Nonomuraea roseola]|uniref:Uncharacterized protein n=1 Tax=Nonomuraea roseola TaxID=46179 RepID=A0ABV5PRU1_9ACTN